MSQTLARAQPYSRAAVLLVRPIWPHPRATVRPRVATVKRVELACSVWHSLRVSSLSMLRLESVPLAHWQAFQSGHFDPSAIARDPIAVRWQRVAAYGLPADGAAHPDGISTGELADRRSRLDAAFGTGDPLAELVGADLATRHVVAILADDAGVIVRAHAAGYARRAVEARLVPGALWHEHARGTNAIGTAIEERRSVAVIGGAHYERVNHGLFCYATPIVDAYGDVVGVFDVTGDVADDDPALATAVRYVGASLESMLRASAYTAVVSGGARIVEHMLDRCSSAAILLEAPGLVRRANARAARSLAIAPEGGTSLEQLFGVSFLDLSREALAGRGTPIFEARGTRYALTLDPIVGSRGRVLSIVAYLDPLQSPPARVTKPAVHAGIHPAFDALIGDDPAVLHAKQLGSRLAPTSVPVLLLAETGTGKELLARAIHAASPRARRPFVALNCGALPPQLLESELFGYAPGSFTGARQHGHEGKIAAAQGGTLFLDEIGEMTPALQALLLRVLEDGSYSRLGEATTRRADFRLICATCRDLPALVTSGHFRSDLFYRIHGASLTLPPLRQRTDRVDLALALLDQLARESSDPVSALASDPVPVLAPSALAHLEAHDWPGNVRELKSALRHALVLSDGSIERDHFPALVLHSLPPPDPAVPSVRQAEAAAVAAAVSAARGNLSEAARRLGIARSTLYRLLRRPPPPS